MSKPEIDSIEGLSPTISIEQKSVGFNPRSTVGTVTEIWDYLRLLYARIGIPICYQCKKPIQAQSQGKILDTLLALPSGTKCSLLSPIVRGRKGEYQKELQQLRSQGFVRVRVDGEILDLSQTITLDKNKKHDIEVYIDRLLIGGDLGQLSTRLSESIELGMRLGQGVLLLQTELQGKKQETLLSEKLACEDCGISYPPAEPRTFSFNSPMGACPTCEGLGTELHEIETDSDEVESDIPRFKEEMTPESHPCETCKGARLRTESLHYLIQQKNIHDVSQMSLDESLQFFKSLPLNQREQTIAERMIKEIKDRLFFLVQVGVHYLSLSRSARTLSGGEAQRIRLATQIGSELTGVIYILDEPSIGLHQSDNDKLLETLKKLRDHGNSVLVVEHDQDTMMAADYLLDLGPGAGVHGGEIMSAGTPAQVAKDPQSPTGAYLSGKKSISVPKKRRPTDDASKKIVLTGVQENNLKNLNVEIPLGKFICVTGVSGSGKSTLIIDTLYKAAHAYLYRSQLKPPKIKKITGLEHLDKMIEIDQTAIGRTPRSNPATYTGVFTYIRDLFARLPESEIRGYKPGRYSFNVKGGRCEVCEGDGLKKIEMHFMADVYVTCETCRGRRYNQETLEVRYKGKNIAETLEMTFDEAFEFFESIPMIHQKVSTLCDVGLGYLKLGQSATTLSGGEAQRVKLAKELSKRATSKTLYILDEPTTGLHFQDIDKLLQILNRLVDQGNTVVVIEHNLDFIKVADHIIDLGPTGGVGGGYILAEGTPEAIVKNSKSITGKYLKPLLV
jgi:excinuclease ABC subunit A